MRICVSADEPDLQALVSEDFGHASFFVIYDTADGSWEAFPNEAPEAGVGAGIMAAETVIKLAPDVVLTGAVGPHGIQKLRSAGIKIIQDEEGTVWSSIQAYLKKHPECGAAQTPARTVPRSDQRSEISTGMRFLRLSTTGDTFCA